MLHKSSFMGGPTISKSTPLKKKNIAPPSDLSMQSHVPLPNFLSSNTYPLIPEKKRPAWPFLVLQHQSL